MPIQILNIVLPFAFNAILAYLKNRDSSNDEKVLEVVKKSCDYLSKKDNNTMNPIDASIMRSVSIKEEGE
jgi:CRISPR/Cas system CSM-associated protein Csm2 small subunit